MGPHTELAATETVVGATAHSEATQQRIRIEQHSASGLLWFAGWLFTIGFLQLPFGKGVLALVIWPYYIGTALTQPLR